MSFLLGFVFGYALGSVLTSLFIIWWFRVQGY